MIKAIIWDMGGVLVRTEDWSYRARWQTRTKRTPFELTTLVFESEMGRKAQLGMVDEEQVWQWVYEQLDLTPDESEQFRQDFFAGDRLDSELVSYIRQLRLVRKTGLLSNAFRGIRAWLEDEWQIADAFDDMLISAEVGIAKPDERIYHLALERLDLAPSEAIFVDDTQVNIHKAQDVGLHAVHFLSPEAAMEAIEALIQTSS